MPGFASPRDLRATGLLTASVALAVASWFAPWAQPAPGMGSAGIDSSTASPWGYFAYMIRDSALNPVSFGALLFGPAALLAVGAIAPLFAVRPWVRIVTTAVVVLASVAGLIFTAVLASAATGNGDVLIYGAGLAFVGYVAPLILLSWRYFLGAAPC